VGRIRTADLLAAIQAFLSIERPRIERKEEIVDVTGCLVEDVVGK
jgi:hypothetical protein